MRADNRDVMKNAHALRYRMAKGEAAVWSKLKQQQTGYKFRRQVAVNRYILDFACHPLMLGVEIDGEPWHVGDEKALEDETRTSWLNSVGWSIVRISDESVRYDAGWVPRFMRRVTSHLKFGTPLPEGGGYLFYPSRLSSS